MHCGVTAGDLDRQILKELVKNSRRSYHQLAEELGVATGTVLKRIKNMESNGIIEGYSIILDNRKLGYEITAIVEIRTLGGKLEALEKKLSRLPNIYGVYETTGSADVVMIGGFKNMDEFSKFTRYLLSIPFVSSTNTQLVLNKVKEELGLLV